MVPVCLLCITHARRINPKEMIVELKQDDITLMSLYSVGLEEDGSQGISSFA